MDEYVRVNFREEREVIIDEEPNGKTNVVLRVETGTHIFTLGGAKDFEPESITRTIRDTNPIEPEDIDFE